MIKHTCAFFPIGESPESSPAYVTFIPLERNTAWYVRQTPFDFTAPNHTSTDWTLVRSGDVVRIPLLPYATLTCDLAQLIVGAMDIQRRYDEYLNTLDVARTHLVVGNRIHTIRGNTPEDPDRYRLWVGYAAQVNKI